MQAVLEGRDEDDIEIPLPPVPLEDLERLAKVAARSTVRECTVTQTRYAQTIPWQLRFCG